MNGNPYRQYQVRLCEIGEETESHRHDTQRQYLEQLCSRIAAALKAQRSPSCENAQSWLRKSFIVLQPLIGKHTHNLCLE